MTAADEAEVYRAGEAARTTRLPDFREAAELGGLFASIWHGTAEQEQPAA